MSWLGEVHAALAEPDPSRKCRRVQAVGEPGAADVAGERTQPRAAIPGRPARPELVSPTAVPHRGFGSVAGRAALVHAVAHIEFNAINLALDACWRFPGMPMDYYRDWLSVARDEARHFQLLVARLAELGFAYGDFSAHNGLWDAAEKSSDDVLTRMALVPRVLEARGLDVTPGLIAKLRQAGDGGTVAVLQLILEEEVRHVAIGSRWFKYLCGQRGLPAEETFREIVARYGMNPRQPFNLEARAAAGFSQAELAGLSRTRSNPAASNRRTS